MLSPTSRTHGHLGFASESQKETIKKTKTITIPTEMKRQNRVFLISAFISSFLFVVKPSFSIAGSCALSVRKGNSIYNYDLTSPTTSHPHGVLSEDGFYKVAVNETLLWFQLCDEMIFNHDPPNCLGCQDCGGSLQCGTKCSALVADNQGGYYVCKTIGYASNLNISLIDENQPETGVIIKMSAVVGGHSCSLSVSVSCDSHRAQVPSSLQLLGDCDYVTQLSHPSGCPKVISADGGGWGWFRILLVIALCLLGAYLVIGSIYRFFFLGIHGAEVIPNLELWSSLCQTVKLVLCRLLNICRSRHGSYAAF